jgi:UDP-3-O-[3-hydroxymyristoyl] glucosamine N-acyltransferase
MSAPRLSLAEIAAAIGAELDGPADRPISGVASLQQARADQLGFFANRRYRKQLAATRAGAVILARAERAHCPVPALLTDNPYLGYARAAALFHPAPKIAPGIHPSASISPRARIAESAWIGPQVVIEDEVEIGEEVFIGAGCSLGAGIRISAGSRLHPRVNLYSGVRLGERVIVHSGAVLGADGFGLANDRGQWIKVPQLGGVEVGDDAEIGANTTVDRGALDDTVLETGVKLDNLIQIAHNVRIGAHTAIAGCVGIAGSTRIGRYCTIGGGVGIVGHIEIVDHVHITGGSTILQSILHPGVYSSGAPLQPNRQWHRNYLRMKQLDELAKRLQNLEDKLSMSTAAGRISYE